MIKSIKPSENIVLPAAMALLPVHEVNTQTAFTPSSFIVDKTFRKWNEVKPPGAKSSTRKVWTPTKCIFLGSGNSRNTYNA